MTAYVRLTKAEIEAICARIEYETAEELAELFEVNRSTIYKWTRGMERAKKRFAKVAVTDRHLLSMASRMKQVEIARQLGITPAAVCIRLKRIRKNGMRLHDQHVSQERPAANWKMAA